MRAKPFTVLSVAIAALAIAACGSSKKSSSTSSSSGATSSTPSTTATKSAGGLPSRTYKVKLAGKNEVPKGAPQGVGNAVVSIHGKTSELCWRFSHLHGFTSPTFAHVHKGAAGTSGNIVVPLSTGSALKHAGCVKTSPTVLQGIEKDSRGYYVNIHSKKYPAGAVRAQL